jgi:hypothetical protein
MKSGPDTTDNSTFFSGTKKVWITLFFSILLNKIRTTNIFPGFTAYISIHFMAYLTWQKKYVSEKKHLFMCAH